MTLTADVFRTVPSWHDHAQCAGRNPRSWDSPDGSGSRADSIVKAVNLCDGCPVAALCAQEALDDRAVGVIRAGVPLLHTASTCRRSGMWDALTAIAGGSAIPLAVLDCVVRSGTKYREATRPLVSLAVARGYLGEVGGGG